MSLDDPKSDHAYKSYASTSQSAEDSMQGTLTNQAVVVFGGSSGIGLATAKLASAEGATVTIVGRDVDRLRAAADAMPRSEWRSTDIRDIDGVLRSVAHLDAIDHIFVSVGEGGTSDILASSMDDLRRPFEERVFATFNVLKAGIPKMKNGSITLMSGMNASRIRRGAPAQTAALCAVESLARTLALDLAPIRINAVAPGWIDTTRLDRAFGNEKSARISSIASQLPGKRIGAAEEVARVVFMLMTVPFINGEVLHIDGAGRFV
jgi:NAD(P)-dependent dehydrogenase (short-subunit alcohol dehydrogenase family)